MNREGAAGTMPQPWLLYDGDCPFCSRYVKFVNLRDTMPELRLVNAREGGPELAHAGAANLPIDEGMVLAMNGQFYHGDACIHVLALMSTPVGLFNRLNHWIFSSPARSRALYPLLRACRNLVLFCLGRSKIQYRHHANL